MRLLFGIVPKIRCHLNPPLSTWQPVSTTYLFTNNPAKAYIMARHLESWQHELIRHMIFTRKFSAAQIADAAECSNRTVERQPPTQSWRSATKYHSIYARSSFRSPHRKAGPISLRRCQSFCTMISVSCTTFHYQRGPFQGIRLEQKASPAKGKRTKP